MLNPAKRRTRNDFTLSRSSSRATINSMPQVSDVRDWLASASRVIALTGAGMSSESGVPTFRGLDGLWRDFKPEDLATPDAFSRNPTLVWEWYDWRRGLIAAASPNPGHHALVTLEQQTHLTVITQNVDGLHTRAGSSHVIEIHGSIWRTRCTSCQRVTPNWKPHLTTLPPLCEECGAMLRPGVVWFGENLPPMAWEASVEAVSTTDILLVIGTSGVVYPAAQLVPIAKESGARIVEINPESTPVSELADATLRGPSGQILPKLLQ
jgi:NAD-dependent deacetylase